MALRIVCLVAYLNNQFRNASGLFFVFLLKSKSHLTSADASLRSLVEIVYSISKNVQQMNEVPRCARIIYSLNYHTGKWAPQQRIDFLSNCVGHEKANAEGELRRPFVGGYEPLYQIAYMIGGLQIMEKRELVDRKRLSYKQFHDSFVQQNMMPIEMERAILAVQTLTKDFKTLWKFYHF